MAKVGGRREGAGRPKGSVSKSTAQMKELAQQYAPEALEELARLARSATSEAARVSAIGQLLDRGYGKPAQPISGDDESPLRLIARIERVVIDATMAQLSSPASSDESNNDAD